MVLFLYSISLTKTASTF